MKEKCCISFLSWLFLLLFCVKTKKYKTIFKTFSLYFFSWMIALYFLCLDAKKVTKKNQGQPETLRAFVRLTPRLTLRKKYFVLQEDKIRMWRSILKCSLMFLCSSHSSTTAQSRQMKQSCCISFLSWLFLLLFCVKTKKYKTNFSTTSFLFPKQFLPWQSFQR